MRCRSLSSRSPIACASCISCKLCDNRCSANCISLSQNCYMTLCDMQTVCDGCNADTMRCRHDANKWLYQPMLEHTRWMYQPHHTCIHAYMHTCISSCSHGPTRTWILQLAVSAWLYQPMLEHTQWLYQPHHTCMHTCIRTCVSTCNHEPTITWILQLAVSAWLDQPMLEHTQ